MRFFVAFLSPYRRISGQHHETSILSNPSKLYRSLITLPFEAIQSELPRASLNKQWAPETVWPLSRRECLAPAGNIPQPYSPYVLQHWTAWSRGNILELYSGGARFEYWLGHQLSWQAVRGFLQSLRVIPGIVTRLGDDRLLLNPFQFIASCPPSYHSTTRYSHHAMKTYGDGGMALSLDLSTRWRWIVSFTPTPLYPRGKSPRYQFDRRVGGQQSRYGHCGVENKKFRKELTDFPFTTYYLIRHGPHRKRRAQQFYCCVCIRCRGNVFTEPLPGNDRGDT
jgi:hypothetical protein